jgi:predicted DNA-binding protein
MKHITSTFRMTKEMYEQIRKEAFNQDVSKSEIIRQACNQYFSLKEKKEDE